MSFYKRPSTDTNHKIVVTACEKYFENVTICNPFGVRRFSVRDHAAELHDMSAAGGENLDWMVIIDDVVIFIEVKVERPPAKRARKLTDEEYYKKMLKPGEISFMENSTARRRICVNEEQVRDFIFETVDYIEMRNHYLPDYALPPYIHKDYKEEKEL